MSLPSVRWRGGGGPGAGAATNSDSRSAKFRSWLRHHSRELQALSEALRASAVFCTGARVEERAEALCATLNLLRIYRDSATRSATTPVLFLEVVRSVELLAEMLFSTSSRGKWVVLTALELAKLFGRSALLVRNGGKFLLESDTRLETPLPPPRCTCGMADIPNAESVHVIQGERTGRKILKASRKDDLGNVPVNKLFAVAYERRAAWPMRLAMGSPEEDCAACSARFTTQADSNDTAEVSTEGSEGTGTVAIRTPPPEEVAAEIMYTLRPLMHLVLVRMFGWRSWRVWGATFAVDVASRALSTRVRAGEETEEEKRRRNLQMLLYLARSPLFDYIVQFFLRRVEAVLRRIPIIGGPVSSTLELVIMLQKYWFYTSGS